METLQFELELIELAKEGDSEAGEEILKSIIRCIDGRRFDSPLFPFLANCLYEYERGIPIERALCIEKGRNVGGRPRKYDPDEIAALDIFLRRELGFKSEESLGWIEANVGMGKKEARELRKVYDARFHESKDLKLMESLDTDRLVHCIGSLWMKVAPLLDDKGGET
tara:strand:+ start:1476 stop:1976 length:501 start_codon:yes stop_codon:yes gene_type:complete